MATSKFGVFVSSTSDDLEVHRRHVRWVVGRLRQASICMETFGAKPTAPLATCRDEVLKADALVVIVGHRYGWIPSATEGGDGHRSITWLEVSWAIEKGTPVFAFLVDEQAPWSGATEERRLREASTDEESLAVHRAVRGLREFRAFLRQRVTFQLFSSETDFVGRVSTSLSNWLRERRPDAATGSAGLPAEPQKPGDAWIGSPFPGLRAFTPADARIFFGRRRETDLLVRKMCDASCRFLLVSGTSGSGKSSLVAAGLIPRLMANAVPGSEDWLLPAGTQVGQGYVWHGLRFTPGELGGDPSVSVAARLAPMLGEPVPAVSDTLTADPSQLAVLIERALHDRPADAQALLFVDQFEELVTTVTDRSLQSRFVEMLAHAARAPRLRLVATVRADFFHRCFEEQPVLAELLRDAGLTVPLEVPGARALADMIEGPAAIAGLAFDEGLVDALVDATISRPGGLALLAFVLHALFEARAGHRLTKDAFAQMGGLSGAIATRAEATLARLAGLDERDLGRVFRQLVIVDRQGTATRDRPLRQDVVAVSGDAARIVGAFERARLLVPDVAPDGTRVLEVAHEALLREWPRLAGWIAERADDLRLLARAEADADEWSRRGRDADHLWPHERLGPLAEAMARLGVARKTLREPARSFCEPEAERLLRELEPTGTSHQRRAWIGERLDRIGDPRPGVGVKENDTPDIAWCAIAPGSVTIEGQRTPTDVPAFHIAKYAVTYRQYTAFLDARDGYGNAELWEGLRRENEPGDQYRKIRNHPAENVSWFDATAFSRWLSQRLGFDVRLPTEAEWQLAASGGRSENVYPWGPEWLEGLANTWESRLSRTTAVGMYPHGVPKDRPMDMAGNVWEWCSDPCDPKKRDRGSGRVLRGGSWHYDLAGARASARSAYAPDDRYDDIGFRVVSVSPIR